MITVRQHMVDPYGHRFEKIKQVKGDLGSGIHDSNGKEIFVNDTIEGMYDGYGGFYPVTGVVGFSVNGFIVTDMETDSIYQLTACLPATIVKKASNL